MPKHDQDTAEYLLPELSSGSFFASSFTPARLDVGAVTHVGKRRKENQDHYAVLRRSRSQQVVASDVPLDVTGAVEDTAYLLMVADGIGGAAFGEFASRVVIQTAWEMTARAASWVMKLQDIDSQQVHDRIQAYLRVFQQTLRDHGEADPRLQGMGTTFTAAYVMGLDAVVTHVGDSRAYLFRGGALSQITHDQTLAQRLIDLGCRAEQVVGLHRVLANCLGCDGDDEVEVEVRHVGLKNGDRLLLCSDGLTRELGDDEIRHRLAVDEAPQRVCNDLLVQALDRGGRDNVTVILADIEDSKSCPQSA